MFGYGQCRPAKGSICDAHESRFKAAKRSYVGSAVLQGGRFATAQDSIFQAIYGHIWVLSSCKGVNLLMLRNRVYWLSIV